MHPQRDCGGGQRRPDRCIAAWRKGPVERCADVIDFPGVISQPFDRGPRCRLTLGELKKVAIILGVAARDRFALSAPLNLLDRVGTGGVEQPEPWLGAADIRDNQGFRHQAGQTVYRIDACRRWVQCHRGGRLDREAAGKDAERPEEVLLVLA